MTDVNDAFRTFRSRLALTKGEQDDAARRQKEIRKLLATHFKRDTDFLTGSYKRHTKTKPLKDVDIFYVLADEERHYRDKPPSVVLGDFQNVLADEYGSENVTRQRRSVSVEFGVHGQPDRVLSFDVVPAFAKNGHYEIPDTAVMDGWTETNPKVHEEMATDAHARFSQEWKGMVRMVKKWNDVHDKPVRPSFLLEVMALDLIRSPFGRDYPYEFKTFFASLADSLHDEWADPAGLGPAVSDGMTSLEKEFAARALREASEHARQAIRLAKNGNNGGAITIWRNDIFGDLFPAR